MKNIKYTVRGGLIGLCAILICLISTVVYADLKSNMDQLIISKSVNETTLTKKQKLFEYRCEMIEKYVGFSDDPTGKATKYSCDHPAVGIAFYAGKDLGKHSPEKVAQYFKDELAKQNIKAEVFIKHGHEYGSSMAFYIIGDSWLRKPINPLDGIKEIETLAAETKLILLTEGQINEWPKSFNK